MNPLEVLDETPGVLDAIVRDHPPARLALRPAEGKWCVTEILGHLVDHEIVTASRIRTTRLDATAWLDRYDQERWVRAQRHREGDPAEFARRFRELRALNLEQWRSLSPEELAAPRRRADGSEIRLRDLLERHAGHDGIHRAQIERTLAAVA